MTTDYITIGLFLLVSLAIGLAMLLIPFVVAKRKKGPTAKYDAYECGNKPFESPRKIIDFKFYLIAILFIIFEVELCVLFPYVLNFEALGLTGYIVMMIFLGLLTIGFIYEWKKGVLDWD
ncbi:MAG: NAD(P)H-quinone oxidoreductase subunit 3 [Proteobacteria bacterium]|nr:NAD(P)H-quinone oxidoreductase subunit 3 [Pseudomonadota bacterium]